MLIFSKEFIPKIFSGAKSSTIRSETAAYRTGDIIHMAAYNDSRKKAILVPFAAAKITNIRKIRLAAGKTIRIHLDGRSLGREEMVYLAQRDGFGSVDEMIRWLRGYTHTPEERRMVMAGMLIEWGPIQRIPLRPVGTTMTRERGITAGKISRRCAV